MSVFSAVGSQGRKSNGLDRHPRSSGPAKGSAGSVLFHPLHLMVGVFVISGWLVSSFSALMCYLVLLPAMAAQWAINRRSCIINNLESWIRTGHWHDPNNCEEGGFLLMISRLAVCHTTQPRRPGSFVQWRGLRSLAPRTGPYFLAGDGIAATKTRCCPKIVIAIKRIAGSARLRDDT
jgi:hypothetical protein